MRWWSPWIRRTGPVMVACAAVGIFAAVTLGAGPPAERAWAGRPCAGPAGVTRRGAPNGEWRQLTPRLDAEGALTGQHLSVGSRTTTARGLELDRESFAAAPIGGLVVVGSDDGSRSRVSILDVPSGCGWSLEPTRDVVRRATLTADGSDVLEVRVDRATRADLGVWRVALTGGPAIRVMDPLEPDARFGRTWSTELVPQSDGDDVAVESCGEAACRVRIFSSGDRGPELFADPAHGEVVGWTRNELVVRGACRGWPCPVVRVGLADGRSRVLDPAAAEAAFVPADDGSPRLVIADLHGRLRSVGPDGSDAVDLGSPPSEMRLLDPRHAETAIAGPAGWVPLVAARRPSLIGPFDISLQSLSDRRVLPAHEVTR